MPPVQDSGEFQLGFASGSAESALQVQVDVELILGVGDAVGNLAASGK